MLPSPPKKIEYAALTGNSKALQDLYAAAVIHCVGDTDLYLVMSLHLVFWQ